MQVPHLLPRQTDVRLRRGKEGIMKVRELKDIFESLILVDGVLDRGLDFDKPGKVEVGRRTYRVRLKCLQGTNDCLSVQMVVPKDMEAESLYRAVNTSRTITEGVRRWIRTENMYDSFFVVWYGTYTDVYGNKSFMPVAEPAKADTMALIRWFNCKNNDVESYSPELIIEPWIDSNLGSLYYNKWCDELEEGGIDGVESWIMKYDPEKDQVIPRERRKINFPKAF